jgi:hypothetical protein
MDRYNEKLPGDYDRKLCGGGGHARGWPRARLIAMDQRYCKVMHAAWATRPATDAGGTIRADEQEKKL